MTLRINQNIAALSAARNLQKTQKAASKAIERLSTAQRINRAADDPAGLVISENLRAQTAGLEKVIQKTGEKVDKFRTEDAKLDEVFNQLRSIRTRALEALNTGASDPLARTANQTSVRSSSETASKTLAGINTAELGVDSSNLSNVANSLKSIDVTTGSGARDALQRVDSAMEELSTFRGELGAFQSNVLESDIRSLGVEVENLRSSESAIRDADFADEVTALTRAQILFQANTAALVQANASAKSVLQLLNG